MRRNETKAEVRALRDAGLRAVEIARQLGISKSTVAYHLRTLGEEPDERFLRRYDWSEIQAYYDEGRTVSECCLRFGFSRESWHAARLRGDIVTRPRAAPIDEWLVAGRRRTRFHLKNRLLAEGLKEHRCEACGIAEWLGKELVLALHHVNGDPSDNRLANLQLLCPNCHSQTENFAGRNRGRPVAE